MVNNFADETVGDFASPLYLFSFSFVSFSIVFVINDLYTFSLFGSLYIMWHFFPFPLMSILSLLVSLSSPLVSTFFSLVHSFFSPFRSYILSSQFLRITLFSIFPLSLSFYHSSTPSLPYLPFLLFPPFLMSILSPSPFPSPSFSIL